MGAGLLGSGMNTCTGDDVLKELNAVFGDPHDPKDKTKPNDRYIYAQNNNSFGSVKDAAVPYRALIAAYSEAGVDVCARWGAYLRKNLAAVDILAIADVRDHALKNNLSTTTTKHGGGGGPLKTHKGKVPPDPKDPSTIDSPY